MPENSILNNGNGLGNGEVSLDSLSAQINNGQANNSGTSDQGTLIGKINDSGNEPNENEIPNRSETALISDSVKLVGRLTLLTAIFGVLGFACMKYDNYIKDYSRGIETQDIKVVQYYEKIKDKFYSTFYDDYKDEGTSIDINDKSGKIRLEELIEDGNKTYIYKKEVIKNSLANLYENVIENAKRLEEIKKHVSAYGFFSDKLSNIISSDEQITSIQDSLTAIRAIKFSSAIAVFSKLDTFVESLAKDTSLSKEKVEAKLENLIDRGEKDINLYIKNCELNAFEVDYECNSIGDFDKYYELIGETTFDTDFFKHLMKFVKDKLEQTEIPSFSITFKGFNQQSNELSFDIVINIQKADKVELAKKGILSPHSFILNSLVNNLKLSRAIVSEGIEVKSIEIEERTITVGMTEFVVETSQKSFTVPIKNENQIEIDDFKY